MPDVPDSPLLGDRNTMGNGKRPRRIEKGGKQAIETQDGSHVRRDGLLGRDGRCVLGQGAGQVAELGAVAGGEIYQIRHGEVRSCEAR